MRATVLLHTPSILNCDDCMAQVRDAGNLLTRAGLSIPAVDVDDLVVRYSTPMELIVHLRAMGETNAVKLRRGTLR